MRLKNTHIAALILLFFSPFCQLKAMSFYNTAHNSFATLRDSSLLTQEIVDGFLTEQNSASETQIRCHSFSVTGNYKYYARIANLNNKPGKEYTVTNRMGKKEKHMNTQWGIVFNYADSLNYNALICQCHNSDLNNDITDQRSMTIRLVHVEMGTERIWGERSLMRDIDLYSGLNALGVEINDNELTVFAGKDKLNTLFRTPFKPSQSPVKVGYIMYPGAKVQIERTAVSQKEETKTIKDTGWNITNLNNYFSSSTDPVEGYWEYLDRETEDKWLRLGGRYVVALVKNDTGYDIIYVSGAQVWQDKWHTGLLKGTMAKTIFTDNYNATWIDATFEPFELDVYATIEQGSILAVKLPVYRSQIRFSKMPLPTFNE